jgi:hypothetical protein
MPTSLLAARDYARRPVHGDVTKRNRQDLADKQRVRLLLELASMVLVPISRYLAEVSEMDDPCAGTPRVVGTHGSGIARSQIKRFADPRLICSCDSFLSLLVVAS